MEMTTFDMLCKYLNGDLNFEVDRTVFWKINSLTLRGHGAYHSIT